MKEFCFLILILICCTDCESSAINFSDLDLSPVEPQVAAKLKLLIRQAEKQPGSARAWGKLAMNFDVHDFKQEAVACYKRARELDSGDFRWSYFFAIVLYEIGSPQALAAFERSCSLKPEYGPAHLRYGQALLDANRMKEAERQFSLVQPKSSHAYLGLARINMMRGEFDAAERHLKEAIKIAPNHAEPRGLLSQIFRRKNESARAEEQLRLSQQLRQKIPPDDPLLLDLIAEGVSSHWYEWRGRAFLERGDYERAIDQLKTAVSISPLARNHDLLGIALQYAKRLEEAAEQHRLALMKESSAYTLNNLATALAELSEYQNAIFYLNKAIAAEPSFTYSYYHLSMIHLREGNTAAAIAALRRGRTVDPTDRRLGLRLSWLLATANDPPLRNGPEAVQIAEPICQSNSSDVECLDILAAAHAESGNFPKAIEVAKRAYQLALNIDSPEFAKRIQSHMKSYQANKAYREE